MKKHIATTQSLLELSDLQLLLAMTRGGTLAAAASGLNLDPSTVFRSVKRLEAKLGQRLFQRGKQGYQPTHLALELAIYAEKIESQLMEAREQVTRANGEPAGLIRITTADALLHGLLQPILKGFSSAYPRINFDLIVSNSMANLSHREADVAIRGTNEPPEHLVGQKITTLRSGVYASRELLAKHGGSVDIAEMEWVSVDDSFLNHSSVRWRQEKYPNAHVRFRCNSVMSVSDTILQGGGIGASLCFLMDAQPSAVMVSGPVPELDTDLWILAHPDMRYLERVKLLFDYLKINIKI